LIFIIAGYSHNGFIYFIATLGLILRMNFDKFNTISGDRVGRGTFGYVGGVLRVFLETGSWSENFNLQTEIAIILNSSPKFKCTLLQLGMQVENQNLMTKIDLKSKKF